MALAQAITALEKREGFLSSRKEIFTGRKGLMAGGGTRQGIGCFGKAKKVGLGFNNQCKRQIRCKCCLYPLVFVIAPATSLLPPATFRHASSCLAR